MKNDSEIALGLTVVSFVLLIPHVRLPLLNVVSNPIIAILLLGGILALFLKGYVLVSIACIVVGLYLIGSSSKPAYREHYTYTPDAEPEPELASPQPELAAPVDSPQPEIVTPEQQTMSEQDSVDIQVASRAFTSEAPPVVDIQPYLLTYPPSDETLRSMSGA